MKVIFWNGGYVVVGMGAYKFPSMTGSSGSWISKRVLAFHGSDLMFTACPHSPSH